ncbi:riboflavin kinase-like isoform X1 [Scylla paramamosain]|uniref:riboflavin kinase-like isoform X1 n=1 Tax=Scylla paramamosain TaxID=85552 RepID=UPI003082D5B1
MKSRLPYFAVGTVVKGFGRGSKELGIPTANFPEHVVEQLPAEIQTGIYYGWAKVDNGPTHKMVMSIGWNPYYKNEKKSMEIYLFQETHIMHVFEDDFYGSELKVIMLGYIRGEKNFNSLEELITAIKGDIAESDKQLSLPEHQNFKSHPFFTGRSEPHCNGITKEDIANGISNGLPDSKKLINGSLENGDNS